MSSKNTESKKSETVDPKATEPETVVNPKTAKPKSDAPTEPKKLGLEALDADNIVPNFTSDPEAPVDRNENVCERAVKAITNGIQTQMKPVMDESGELLRDPTNGKIKQVPVDPNQCRVWQSRYQAAGRLPAEIEFPDNPGAEALEQMCQEHNRVILYTIHRTLLDDDRKPKPLPSNPSKNQHGHYMLAIILPKPQETKDSSGRMVALTDGSPRDKFLRDFRERIPEFPASSIGKGETVFKHLVNNTPPDEDWNPEKNEDNQVERDNGTYPQTGLQKARDFLSKLTVPTLPGDRNIARPEDIIFLRAASGFDQLYINVRNDGEAQRRPNTKALKIPETKTVGNAPDPLGVIES